MNKISKILASASVLAMGMLPAGCNEDSPVSNPPVDNKPVEIERGTYARGADVSWLDLVGVEQTTAFLVYLLAVVSQCTVEGVPY